jgi:hypothetical protein
LWHLPVPLVPKDEIIDAVAKVLEQRERIAASTVTMPRPLVKALFVGPIRFGQDLTRKEGLLEREAE